MADLGKTRIKLLLFTNSRFGQASSQTNTRSEAKRLRKLILDITLE